MDVNGSVRPLVEQLIPSEYIGIDISPGPGVDLVLSAENIVEEFGQDSFDMVISTEMVEHVLDWRRVISEMKRVVRPGSHILLTTRSRGFPLHGYPYDFWRYETNDIRVVFSDFQIQQLEADAVSPGVFVRARKPDSFTEVDLAGYNLFSILRNRRASRVTPLELVAIKSVAMAWYRADAYLPRWAIERMKTMVRERRSGGPL